MTRHTRCHQLKNFENLLNPHDQPKTIQMNFAECPYIPVLDDPIQVNEVIESIKESKADKAYGINGISPGIFKMLPFKRGCL